MRSSRFAAVALLAASAALSAGCVDDRTLYVGALEVSPAALAFGEVNVGLSSTVVVSVTNPSRKPVAMPAVKIATDPNGELSLAGLFTTDCAGAPRASSSTLAAGECASFTVTWSPKAAHAAAGSVEIDPGSDDSNIDITLPVTGLALSTDYPALSICQLDESGAVDPTECTDLGAHPPAIPTIDFGSGQLHVPSSVTLRFTNTGTEPLLFPSPPALSPATPPQFVLPSSALTQLAPGASLDLAISATPDQFGTLLGELDVASNDPRDALVPLVLHLATTGIAICVEPSLQVDYGLTLIGTGRDKTFALSNCGQGGITVDSFSFTPVAPTSSEFTFTTGTAPVLGASLSPGGQLQASVTYAPTAARSDAAALDFNFGNSYGVNRTRVRLTGTGVTTYCGTSVEPRPTASIAASYSSSQGGPYQSFDPTALPGPVQPLDYVQLSAAGSQVVGTPTYTWQLVSQPAGSTTTLNGTGEVVTMQTLVSGDYVVELSAADGNGCAGTQQVTVHVASTGDVHIELTWAESCGDLDLHYVGPGGELCDFRDTAYYNTNPDWGCTTQGCGGEQDPGGIYPDGISIDDPTLDHDDLWGNGPENITQKKPFDSPANTPYQIYVHYYSSTPDGGGGSGVCGQTHPTINIFLGGVLANTFTLDSGMSNDETWFVAALGVANQGATFAVTPGETVARNSHACSGNGDRHPKRPRQKRF